ncbi:RNA polymerase sigma-70 factor [Parabacteroides faecis]|uniref:RNA polymerase sigma-70 factor n=1 Tax=Parabacteroides faecis TaxID=1217282 RepID=UPI0021645C46|nr:RNA polymerase sigma-70 factor [Parabacteroides faecis]MCS2892648.1 RNA polymerase sigma-70 factor [Parabacteroides faecis]UVQ48728.1 RNA polymerase sigma-70 factor [Parabacteroides faecis]
MEKAVTENIDYLLWSISNNDDQVAYRSLFEQYYVSLCQFARRYIDDQETREDIVQDVFFTIWDKRKTITPSVSAKNFLITCVKNHSLNYLRNLGYKREYETVIQKNIPIYFENQDDLYTLQELQHLLNKTLEKLPPEYRLAFELNRFENKNIEEIAEIMGVSTRTVKRYKSKAIEILKEELKDYLPLFMLFTSIFDK